jgi:hypothetical protein
VNLADKIRGKRAQRFEYLRKLYEMADGNTEHPIEQGLPGHKLGLNRQQSREIEHYLMEEGLVEGWTFGRIAISHLGLTELEEALTRPNEPTVHFPAVNIIQVEQMIDSQIQQASPSATQVISARDELQQLREVVESLGESVDQLAVELSLPQEDKSDLMAHVKTLEAQLQAASPRTAIVKQCLAAIVTVIKGATVATTGSLVAMQVVERIQALLSPL